MTNCRNTLFDVYSLVGPSFRAHPVDMWLGMLMPVYNLCRNTLYTTRAGV